MTQDEIISMMKAAEKYADKICYGDDRMCDIMDRVAYERFATLVAEAKRKQTLCEAAAIVLMSPSREAAVDVLQEMGK